MNINSNFQIFVTCEIVGYLNSTYGKFEDWMFDTIIIMEYNEFYPL